MYAQVKRTKENKSSVIVNSVAQKQSRDNSFFQFVDNRPEAYTQQKTQKMVNSPHMKQLISASAMADNISDEKRIAQFKKGLFQRKCAGASVIQKFNAGIGSGWHIHHRNHVKYDSNDATRVDFAGRTRRQIGYRWEQVIQSNGLAGTKGTPDFIACKTWIRNHIV